MANVEGSDVCTGPIEVVMSRIICSPALINDPAPFTATELLVKAMLVGDNVLAGSTETLVMGEDNPEKSYKTPLKLPLVALPLDVYDWIIWSADTVIPSWKIWRVVVEKRLPTGKLTGTVPVSTLLKRSGAVGEVQQ